MSPSSPPEQTVVIAAAGAVTGLGLGVDALRRALRSNTSALAAAGQWAIPGQPAPVVGAVPAATWEALGSAGPDPADDRAFLLARAALAEALEGWCARARNVAPGRFGLVLSTTKADVAALERVWRGLSCSPAARRHADPFHLATDLAERFHLRGPVRCVSAACVSGLLAVQQAAEMIRRGEVDCVVVVGVDLVSRFVLAGFQALKSLDPAGCRPFDRSRVGLSLGEGAGALVLAPAGAVGEPAVEVAGWGSSNDANHLTGPSRDGSGLALAMQRALACAGAEPGAVDYLHAHGTGTPFNDAMEALAFRSVFGEQIPAFSGSKGMLGHTLGAAGVLETIVCWLALQDQQLPGNSRILERDPAVPDSLVLEPRAAGRLQTVIKVNAGFGGMNAAILLRRTGSEHRGLALSPSGDARAGVLEAQGFMGPEGLGSRPGQTRPLTSEQSAAAATGHFGESHWMEWFGTDPARFARMDFLSQLGFIAAEQLASALAQLSPEARRATGVVLETRHGCVATDLQFLQTPRPSIFPYTLPSTVIGEICIRHRLQGPVLCLVTADGGGASARQQAESWIRSSVVRHCLCLAVDAVPSAALTQPGASGVLPARPVWRAAAWLVEGGHASADPSPAVR